MIIKSEKDLSVLRESGARLAKIMDELVSMVDVGVSTDTLDERARNLARAGGDKPAFLGYQPHGAGRPYPATLCTSVNEQVVHGIPNEDPYVFQNGDVVTLDMGLIHEGFITDMAFTVGVGEIDKDAQRLIAAAREALSAAISVARAGNTTGDIGNAVETVAQKYGFSVSRELGGHGVGEQVHEEPFIPNFGIQGQGTELVKGMVLAIEPIIIEGEGNIELEDDGYTYCTKDGSRATQFEHTVLVTDRDPKILTKADTSDLISSCH